MKKIKKRYFLLLPMLALLFVVLCRCNTYKKENIKYPEIEYLIGVSQANMREAWRVLLIEEIKQEAEKYKNIRFVVTDATNSLKKQEKDVSRLLGLGIDLLIISPYDVESMKSLIEETYQDVPVIVMDRAIEGYDYSLFIGPDNERIGRQAAESVLKIVKGKEHAVILDLCGNEKLQSNQGRRQGFESVIEKQSKYRIIKGDMGKGTRDEAYDYLLNKKKDLEKVDVIFTYNDAIALGTDEALKKMDVKIPIVSVDGVVGLSNGTDLVKDGIAQEVITCPSGGKEAIQYAVDILTMAEGVPKQIILRSQVLNKENVEDYIRKKEESIKKDKNIIDIGFCQVGSESSFRRSNTRSVQEAAKNFGMNLIYKNAEQSQEEQIKIIREFIQMNVDVIAISPIVEEGWEEILKEIKKSGIPIFLCDRKIKIKDDTLISAYIGADFVEEGRRAMRWIMQNTMVTDKPIQILEILGTKGASPTVERKQGFDEVLQTSSNYKIAYSATGDYTKETGKQLVEEYLTKNKWDFDVVFSQNDDMALGAIEALKEHGIKPGKDVIIVSVDGTKEAFEAMIRGDLNCTVECTPLLGPQLMKAIQNMIDGKDLPLRIITDEKVFDQKTAKKDIRTRLY